MKSIKYKIDKIDFELLRNINLKYKSTVFCTYEWVSFLKKDQNAEPVLLEIKNSDDIVIGYFISLIVKKLMIKIMGSPFEGWLTPDMGFIEVSNIDYKLAVESVVSYAFSSLKCHFVQICDKKISKDIISIKHRVDYTQLLKLNLEASLEDIISNFTKNGRRDVRASSRKEISIRQVTFDQSFAEVYYNQLVDVFAKQGLKPNYSKEKITNLVEAFSSKSDLVIALEVIDSKSNIIATVFSFGLDEWAYYVGAASYRTYQKYLPNEAIFWELIKLWKSKNIKYLDLMGYREYKLKYNPEIINHPRFIFEKFPGLFFIKQFVKYLISLYRKTTVLFFKNNKHKVETHENINN